MATLLHTLVSQNTNIEAIETLEDDPIAMEDEKLKTLIAQIIFACIISFSTSSASIIWANMGPRNY